MYVHIYDNCRFTDLTAFHVIGNLGPGDYRQVVKPKSQLPANPPTACSWTGR